MNIQPRSLLKTIFDFHLGKISLEVLISCSLRLTRGYMSKPKIYIYITIATYNFTALLNYYLSSYAKKRFIEQKIDKNSCIQ